MAGAGTLLDGLGPPINNGFDLLKCRLMSWSTVHLLVHVLVSISSRPTLHCGLSFDRFNTFYRASSALAVYAMVVCPSVCLSVCLSVTSRSSTKMAKGRNTQTTPHDSPGTLVFWCQKYFRNSNGVTPNGGAKCRWGRSCLLYTSDAADE